MATEMTTQLRLFFRAKDLIDVDTVTVSDPYVVLYAINGDRAVEVGRTETIMNDLNPTFKKFIKVDYHFELRQDFVVRVYDYDSGNVGDDTKNDLLGEATFQLSHIVGSLRGTKNFPMKGRGQLFITAEDIGAGRNDTLVFDVAAVRMKGSPEAQLVVKRITPHGARVVLHETIKAKPVGGENRWPAFSHIKMADATHNFDPNTQVLVFEVMSFGCCGGGSVLGSATVCVNELQRAKDSGEDLPLVSPGGGGQLAGYLKLRAFQINKKIGFVELLTSGWQINLAVAVDFTASNREPQQRDSLHYRDPSGAPNQYQRALMSVGAILLEYDTDKNIPMFGFGGKLPDGVTSHCFHLNLQPNPYVHGMDGMLQAYGQSLAAVRLSGPTNFAPIIRNVTAGARAADKCYTVLLIITDGEISDIGATTDAIVEADDAPLSIVIVGVGNGSDFVSMNVLDGDDVPLVSSTGRRTRRDLVQFVPMRDFIGAPIPKLAAATLEEIPDQVQVWANLVRLVL